MTGDPEHRLKLAAKAKRHVPAFFLDRDGTLIDDPGYIADPDKVRLIPEAVAALHRFRDAGYALVLVTNQSGIGRGLYRWADYDAVAARLTALLACDGLVVDAEVACGHSPEEGAVCGWRKPAPGMIRAAARALDLDLGGSVLAGDKLSDIEAAAAAGIPRAVHVLTGHGAAERAAVVAARPKLDLVLAGDLSGLVP
jgi:D-glycero-D-manno-heptose 1,7-bisphosphate phosphatase